MKFLVTTNLAGDKYLIAGNIIYKFNDIGALKYRRRFTGGRVLNGQPVQTCSVISILKSREVNYIEMTIYEGTKGHKNIEQLTQNEFRDIHHELKQRYIFFRVLTKYYQRNIYIVKEKGGRV